MRKFILTTICIILTAAVAWAADETPNADTATPAARVLTLTECVDAALLNHPNISVARYSVMQAQSKVGQMRAGYLPQLSATGSYSRFGYPSILNSVTSDTYSDSDTYTNYTADVTLTQTLFDFGRTYMKMKVQGLNAESSRMSLEDTIAQTVYNAKSAYYNVLLAQRKRDVARDVVAQFEHHLDQAGKFFEVGLRPKFDVTKAEADLSAARADLIKAENASRIAMVTLNVAMGTPVETDHTLENIFMFEHPLTKFEDFLSLAYERRADLRAVQLQFDAAERAVIAAGMDFLPTITGSAAYKWSDTEMPMRNESWNAGVAVKFDILSGGLSWYQVQEARAVRDGARESLRLLRQQIYLDVDQAYLGVASASLSIPATELSLNKAKENLDIANGRYAAGVGDPIEVTDAQVAYKNAQLALLQALADYKLSQAALDLATGGR